MSKPQSTQGVPPWVHFVAGGVGGTAAAVVTSPLDVLKTRLQSTKYQRDSVRRGPLSGKTLAGAFFPRTGTLLVQIYKHEGCKVLFRGLGPTVLGVMTGRAMYFGAYSNGKNLYANWLFQGREVAGVHVMSAMTAGIINCTVTNPIWLVKTRLQLDQDHAGGKYKNSWDCATKTVRHEGTSGLYRGMTASYLGISQTVLQWALYEQAKKHLCGTQNQSGPNGDTTSRAVTRQLAGQLVAASAAKFFATLVTYPHEVARTRLRELCADRRGNPKYNGLWRCFQTIVQQEGATALYGGLGAHLFRVVPNATIMFGIYEVFVWSFV